MLGPKTEDSMISNTQQKVDQSKYGEEFERIFDKSEFCLYGWEFGFKSEKIKLPNGDYKFIIIEDIYRPVYKKSKKV